jgi:hypothetical protein
MENDMSKAQHLKSEITKLEAKVASMNQFDPERDACVILLARLKKQLSLMAG